MFSPTRINHNSKTCIDNLVISLSYNYVSPVISTGLSDHEAQMLCFTLSPRDKQNVTKKSYEYILKRVYSSESILF